MKTYPNDGPACYGILYVQVSRHVIRLVLRSLVLGISRIGLIRCRSMVLIIDLTGDNVDSLVVVLVDRLGWLLLLARLHELLMRR